MRQARRRRLECRPGVPLTISPDQSLGDRSLSAYVWSQAEGKSWACPRPSAKRPSVQSAVANSPPRPRQTAAGPHRPPKEDLPLFVWETAAPNIPHCPERIPARPEQVAAVSPAHKAGSMLTVNNDSKSWPLFGFVLKRPLSVRRAYRGEDDRKRVGDDTARRLQSGSNATSRPSTKWKRPFAPASVVMSTHAASMAQTPQGNPPVGPGRRRVPYPRLRRRRRELGGSRSGAQCARPPEGGSLASGRARCCSHDGQDSRLLREGSCAAMARSFRRPRGGGSTAAV